MKQWKRGKQGGVYMLPYLVFGYGWLRSQEIEKRSMVHLPTIVDTASFRVLRRASLVLSSLPVEFLSTDHELQPALVRLAGFHHFQLI